MRCTKIRRFTKAAFLARGRRLHPPWPIRYGPARLVSASPFQLSRALPSATSLSTAAWTTGITARQSGAARPSSAAATSARATSLGQTVAPGARLAKRASAASRASAPSRIRVGPPAAKPQRSSFSLRTHILSAVVCCDEHRQQFPTQTDHLVMPARCPDPSPAKPEPSLV